MSRGDGLGPFATPRQRADAIIRTIFDRSYYLRQYPDIAKSNFDPLTHFLTRGWAELRNPCALFDTAFYLERYPDVAEAGLNPLLHYARYGARERRQVSLLFDTDWYLARYPDVAENRLNPLAHYLAAGAREGRNANPLFDQDWYLKRYPHAAEAAPCALAHFAECGARDKLSPHPGFDGAAYLERNPDVARAGVNPLAHYLAIGGKEGREATRAPKSDPVPHPHQHSARAGLEAFDRDYYLVHNPDVAAAGLDPLNHYLLHGKAEGRQPVSYSARIRSAAYAPLISVIVPNYNHARFLRQRLESIYGQTYQNLEVIILDDASSDESLEIIDQFKQRHSDRTSLLRNARNSGSVFSQWRKGCEAAKGELIWICESDDYADVGFLEHVVGAFADSSVMLAFGRVQFADAKGEQAPGLDAYREAAEAGIWNEPTVRCAHEWFTRGFAVSNLIPNVGGCVFRRQALSEDDWQDALRYRVLGDWFLYIVLARGGRIAYHPAAISYFRQHGANTSVAAFRAPHYYTEHHRIGEVLRKRWGAPDEALRRLSANVEFQYARVDAGRHIAPLDDLFSIRRLTQLTRSEIHILIAILGFELGGGEIFPINLANALVAKGYVVSVLVLDSRREDPEIRKRLDTRVAVYDSHFVREIGSDRFLRRAGVDVIHSHNVGLEYFFFVNAQKPPRVPYLVTLHGSYECAPIAPRALSLIVSGVDRWVYLADKNLKHLDDWPVKKAAALHVPNGIPRYEQPVKFTRASLGIGESDIVFAIASRPLKSKGWEEAIQALAVAQARTGRNLRLLLCGDGPEIAGLRAKYENEAVRFMGYQENVVALFGIADCVLLPTRFEGESFPLCIIEALQAGAPVIATDIGEIPRMLTCDGARAGELLMPIPENAAFVANLAEAMQRLSSDDGLRSKYASVARVLGKKYDIETIAARYAQIYSEMIAERAGADLRRGE